MRRFAGTSDPLDAESAARTAAPIRCLKRIVARELYHVPRPAQLAENLAPAA
jgi:hypothetical protein